MTDHAPIVTPEGEYGVWRCLACGAEGRVLHSAGGPVYWLWSGASQGCATSEPTPGNEGSPERSCPARVEHIRPITLTPYQRDALRPDVLRFVEAFVIRLTLRGLIDPQHRRHGDGLAVPTLSHRRTRHGGMGHQRL